MATSGFTEIQMGNRPPTIWTRIKRADDGVLAILAAIFLTALALSVPAVILLDNNHRTLGWIFCAPIIALCGCAFICLFVGMWAWAFHDWRKFGS